MKKILLYTLAFCSFNTNLIFAQSREVSSPYKIKNKLDIPLAVAGVALSSYGFYRLAQKSSTDSLTVVNLEFEEEIIRPNRFRGPRYSESASTTSDYLFYGSMPVPFFLFLDKNMRRDAGRITVMYLQALGLTGSMYTMTASNVDKYRPLVYDTSAPFSERTEGNAKNSFFAGHPAVTATAMFFAAKVVSDYYPERKGLNWFMYSSATLATVANGYLRYKAGKHFPSDILVGMGIGALNGILVPHFHKVKRGYKKKGDLSWNLFTGEAHGLTLAYKFK